MLNIAYQEVPFKKIESFISENIILLITATDLETRELHKYIKPLSGQEKILMIYHESLTFYLGVFGRYKIAHLQCAMGSISRESSILTISNILKIVHAGGVIMPGIAFGVDENKQHIGDVLVAEAIQPYNNKRVGDEVVQRAYAMQSSKILLNRFKNVKNWSFPLGDDNYSKAIYSLILSGEELIDNKEYRDELLSKYYGVSGGEMEGAGVYAACDGKIDCILIKGICDFADGNKKEGKELKQTLAVRAAIDLCLQVFSSQTAFEELGVKSCGTEESIPVKKAPFKDVLFDIYDPSKEPYYIKRDIDSEFKNNIEHMGAWVYGISGSGKSTLIAHNLNFLDIEYIQINLASCLREDHDALFYEIYFELVTKLEGFDKIIAPVSFVQCVKHIITLLKKHCRNKKYVIFIEEIPLDDELAHKEFAQRLYSLLITKSYDVELEEIRFILSSINNPINNVQTFNQKIYNLIKFVRLENWDHSEILRLIQTIISECNIDFSNENVDQLIKSSNGSPRFVKKFFRNLCVQNDFSESKISATLKETQYELFPN